MSVLEIQRAELAHTRDMLLERTSSKRAELETACVAAIHELADKGDWQGAVMVAVNGASLSQADIARGLEVMRSTVSRWMNGKTQPPEDAIRGLADNLSDLVLRQAAR